MADFCPEGIVEFKRIETVRDIAERKYSSRRCYTGDIRALHQNRIARNRDIGVLGPRRICRVFLEDAGHRSRRSWSRTRPSAAPAACHHEENQPADCCQHGIVDLQRTAPPILFILFIKYKDTTRRHFALEGGALRFDIAVGGYFAMLQPRGWTYGRVMGLPASASAIASARYVLLSPR